ncbi:MAG: hypothetical protein SGBAC_004777 [Bacillariaceae sp.]
MSHVFGRLHKSVIPTVASPSHIPNSSSNSNTSGRMDPAAAALGADPRATQNSGIIPTIGFLSGEAEGMDNAKALVLQELKCTKIAKEVEDIATQELEITLEENQEVNYLHNVESNAKLEAAKAQHAAAEKKLKELYASKCRHQQSKILELYSENQKLSERLQDTRGTRTADSIHLSTVQETLHRTIGTLESKRKEADELKRQNGHFQERLSLLEGELDTFREKQKGLLLELEMSRTMAKEMERRVEASSMKSVEALEGVVLKKQEEVKTTQAFVSQLKGEGGDLFAHVNNLETGVKALQDENEELRWERDRAKIELAESKNEIAVIHENLLQNLENGASCLHVDSGGDDCDYSNVETSLVVTEQMKDTTARYQASRCALVVLMMREKIREDRSMKHLTRLDAFNQELFLALQKSHGKGRLLDAELESRNKEMLSLKRGAEEMETALHMIADSQIQDRDQHFKKLLKVGVFIDPQSMTVHHLISTMRRNTEVLQVSLSRMERNLGLLSLQFEQKSHSCHADLQVAMESENELKRKLEVTMEKLSNISIKLRHSEQEKADNHAALRDSEETLSDAVEVIKKLEADIKTKDRDLESAETRISELKDNEDILSSEHIGLFEKILVLEERLTESTEDICKLRRNFNSVESRKTALEMKIQTMTDVSEDLKKSLLDNKVLQANVSALNNQLKTCRTELDQAHATKLLLESDLMDLVDKSEDHRRNESSKMEQSMHQLLAEASRESDLCNALQQKHVEATQTLESLKQKHSALNITFLASMGISDTNNQFLLNANKTLERAINERMGDVKELKQVVSSSQGKIEDLRGECQRLQKDQLHIEDTRVAETHGLKCDIAALESALDFSKTQHLATRATLQKEKEMRAEVTVQRDALQVRIADARDEEVSLLRSTVRRAQFRYCASLAAIEGMNRLSSKTAEDLAMKNSQISSLADQIFNIEDELKYIEDNYDLENRLLRGRIDELRRTVCSLLAASVSEHYRSRKDDTRAGDTKATISQLQTELDCTRSKLLLAEADLRESSIAHKNENDSLAEKTQAFKDQIEDVEQRLRLSREECNVKTREIRSLQICSMRDQDRIIRNLQLFEGEKKQFSATLLDMAEELSNLKRDIEDLQEDRTIEIEDGKILLESLKCDRESILSTLVEAKKKAHDEEQRYQTSKVELESLKRNFDKLHCEKLVDEGSIRVLEKRVEELVREKSTNQRESNEWQLRAESFNIKLQAMTKKYGDSVVEIASLLEKSETERMHLNRSEAVVASLNKQQAINESELKKNGIMIAKVEEEKENALWERDEAKIRLDVLDATDTQLRRKVEMLAKEKRRLLNDRCIAEAALVGLHRQNMVNCRIFSPKDQEIPETMPREQQLLEGTTLTDFDSNAGNSSCTEIEPTRDANCAKGTPWCHEVSLTRSLMTSSKTLVNLNGNGRLVGARLLSLVVEQKMRMEVAGAFRRWSCANNATKATSQLHKTSKELSQQLHCTREKLLVLKSHIKATAIQRKESEPRLRKVLMPLTNQHRLKYHGDKMKL